MKQITEHVYAILTRMSYLNFYVIAYGDDLTIIDIALGSGDVDRLETELDSHHWSLENVKHILITHAHPDHIGGLQELQSRCNAHTAIHRLDAPVVRGDKPGEVANPDELGFISRLMLKQIRSSSPPPPARVDSELQDGDVLDAILPGLQVIHLPGHSYGQCGFWLEDTQTLIGGDVMMRVFSRLRMPLRAPSPDWAEAKRSIQKVAAMKVDTLCLGHGAPMIGNASKDIKMLAGRV